MPSLTNRSSSKQHNIGVPLLLVHLIVSLIGLSLLEAAKDECQRNLLQTANRLVDLGREITAAALTEDQQQNEKPSDSEAEFFGTSLSVLCYINIQNGIGVDDPSTSSLLKAFVPIQKNICAQFGEGQSIEQIAQNELGAVEELVPKLQIALKTLGVSPKLAGNYYDTLLTAENKQKVEKQMAIYANALTKFSQLVQGGQLSTLLMPAAAVAGGQPVVVGRRQKRRNFLSRSRGNAGPMALVALFSGMVGIFLIVNAVHHLDHLSFSIGNAHSDPSPPPFFDAPFNSPFPPLPPLLGPPPPPFGAAGDQQQLPFCPPPPSDLPSFAPPPPSDLFPFFPPPPLALLQHRNAPARIAELVFGIIVMLTVFLPSFLITLKNLFNCLFHRDRLPF